MNARAIARRRLQNQRLIGAPFAKPERPVRWFGAMQAQDYGGAKWAIGQRTQACADADVEQAFQDGLILRTHVMRPTWHFVSPVDIRWMLELTAPRVHAANAYPYRKLELDDATLARSRAVLVRALRGGKHATRRELQRTLERAGIRAAGPRLGYVLMNAELQAEICSGPRRGRQFTYALLEERAPAAKSLRPDEALLELTTRYFTSHGPALVRDFAWWSGLGMATAKRGVEMAKSQLVAEAVDGRTFWFAPPTDKMARWQTPIAHLLPNYDEYLIAYRDHGPSFDAALLQTLDPRGNTLASHIIVIDGLVVGGWRRILAKQSVTVEIKLLRPLARAEMRALRDAANRYGKFLGLPAEVMAVRTAGRASSRSPQTIRPRRRQRQSARHHSPPAG